MILKQAILKTWSAGTFTATIQISGSSKAYLEGVKVARNIPSVEMVAGRFLVVAFADKNNPADAVVIGVYA